MRVTAIIDLQYGSTGKGLLAGYLGMRQPFSAVVTAWAPNAGHTYVDPANKRWVHTQVANAAVWPTITEVFIGPGSVISPPALLAELEALPTAMRRFYIHECAAVVRQDHRDAEGALVAIGSTQKGVSEALIEKMRRSLTCGAIARVALKGTPLWDHVVPADEYLSRLAEHEHVLVEGHQGHSLSIHSGFYPYVTSRDTSVHAVLADCAVPRPSSLTVWGCLRTFPIRVANRYDQDGALIGWSGPVYADQREIEWAHLGLEPELTTVTKRPRRIFTYSSAQIRQACVVNRPDCLFVNFMNYLPASNRWPFVQQVADDAGVNLHDPSRWLFGYGPRDSDVMDGQRELETH